MRNNSQGIFLEGESKEQYLNTVPKSYPLYIYIGSDLSLESIIFTTILQYFHNISFVVNCY